MVKKTHLVRPGATLHDIVRHTGRILAGLGLISALGYGCIAVYNITQIVRSRYKFFGQPETIVVDAAAVIVFPALLFFFFIRCLNVLRRYNMGNRTINRDGFIDQGAKDMLKPVSRKLVILGGRCYQKITCGIQLVFIAVAVLYVGGTVSAYAVFISKEDDVNQELVKELLEWHTLMLIFTISAVHLFLGERAKYLMLGLYEVEVENDLELEKEFKIIRKVLATRPVVIMGISRDTTCYSMTLQQAEGIKLPPATVQELKSWGWDEYVKPIFWSGEYFTVSDPGEEGAKQLSTLVDTDRVCAYRGYPTATQERNAMRVSPRDYTLL